MRTVIGLIGDAREAKRSIDDLKKLGAKGRNISVVARNVVPGYGDLRLAPVEVPGLGRVAACGPLPTYLSEAASGEELEDTVHALVGMGVPLADAQRYVEGVQHGSTLEAVLVQDDKAEEARAIIREHQAGADVPDAVIADELPHRPK